MNYYTKYLSDFQNRYSLYIPLFIIFQSCLGSVAAMYILMNSTKTFHFFELILCVSVCMIYNSSVLAQVKSKWVFNLLILSVIVNTFLILLNLSR